MTVPGLRLSDYVSRADEFPGLRVYEPLIDLVEHSMGLQSEAWRDVATVLTHISARLRSTGYNVPELFDTVTAEMIRRAPEVEVASD